MPYKVFVAGQSATAAEANSYLMRQSVVQFPDYAAAVAAYVSPTDGAMFVLPGGQVFVWTSGAWISKAPRGWVGESRPANALTSSGTATTLPGSAIAFSTGPDTRRIEANLQGLVYTLTAGAAVRVGIFVDGAAWATLEAVTTTGLSLSCFDNRPLTAGAHTADIRMWRVAGTGQVNVNTPHLLVKDTGPGLPTAQALPAPDQEPEPDE